MRRATQDGEARPSQISQTSSTIREPGRPGWFPTQAPHRSGRARRRRIRLVTSQVRCPSHDPSALQCHAARSDALGVVPAFGLQRGSPFAPRGPGGPVPPLPRYYEALRLPDVHLAALRCLRLAIPSLRPSFVPDGPGHGAVDRPGVGKPGLQPAFRWRRQGLPSSRGPLVIIRHVL